MNKYITEFIGTYFLVLAVGLAVIGGAASPPIAIGAMLMVMIFAGGHISGAHYNPAVTLGVWMRGKCDAADVPFYVIAQLVAGALAALTVAFLLGGKIDTFFAANPTGSLNPGPSMIAEFIGTFALVYVILNVATSKGTEGNSFYGLAIGFTVTACAYTLGPISGGAFNPAVALGTSIMGLAKWSDIWIYLVPQLLAGAAAALVFKATDSHGAE